MDGPLVENHISENGTMRRNLLNWCNLVSISKKLRFYVLGVVRIYKCLADLLQKIMMKNSKLQFSV